jgi:hypothetical protein
MRERIASLPANPNVGGRRQGFSRCVLCGYFFLPLLLLELLRSAMSSRTVLAIRTYISPFSQQTSKLWTQPDERTPADLQTVRALAGV